MPSMSFISPAAGESWRGLARANLRAIFGSLPGLGQFLRVDRRVRVPQTIPGDLFFGLGMRRLLMRHFVWRLLHLIEVADGFFGWFFGYLEAGEEAALEDIPHVYTTSLTANDTANQQVSEKSLNDSSLVVMNKTPPGIPPLPPVYVSPRKTNKRPKNSTSPSKNKMTLLATSPAEDRQAQ